jgi:hypothetical protein
MSVENINKFLTIAKKSIWKYAFLCEANMTGVAPFKVEPFKSGSVALIVTGTGNIEDKGEMNDRYKNIAMMRVNRGFKLNLIHSLVDENKTNINEYLPIVEESEKKWLKEMESEEYIEIHVNKSNTNNGGVVAIFNKDLSLYANAFAYILKCRLQSTHSVTCHCKLLKHKVPENGDESFKTRPVFDNLLLMQFASADQVA